ncbi:sulfotransferase [Congregibacter brevis]|uniref:Sulfotransferase n=1 Tax=Congregibacter brevis TaxID=3081201 RepID=A0ABZ0IFQ0_9GAMM|nr:sulfotransferase [Congregibacter sp. IMCC45268]
MKNFLKHQAIDLFIRFLRHSDVAAESDRQFHSRHKHLPAISNDASPYSDLGKPISSGATENAIFITGRFRSGSTLLWNMFRQMNECTAYYEPFNERQWFNPHVRGNKVDATHRGVDDYSREYDGMTHLANLYSLDWIKDDLFMCADTFNPNMHQYISELIAHTGNTSVLQFNRVDFRLPWLKHHFPSVPIVHIYRHPREQWVSFLADPQKMQASNIETTYKDSFYLDTWSDGLAPHFPFLNRETTPHPYKRFYYIWKLSWLFAKKYADTSVKYDDLVARPRENFHKVLDEIGFNKNASLDDALKAVDPPSAKDWSVYAPDEWFRECEKECEKVLSQFLCGKHHSI